MVKQSQGSTYGDRESKNDANKNRNRAAAKYRREYEADKKSKNDTSINFPLLRYSDILLMIAEAENEVNHGPNDLAYECINAVRERAGIKNLQQIWMKRASAKRSKTNVQWNSVSSTHVVST